MVKPPNKTNTHFLTDSIIRTCLNMDGSPIRGKGFYFDVSGKGDIKFNFQQETSVQLLENALGRPATDEEIEKAKKNPFTADYVFCSECEKIFTDIETEFIDKVLPLLRNADLDGKESIVTSHRKVVRQFFYLQFWRSAICEKHFEIPANMMEQMRQSILNHRTVSDADIPDLPLYINYLETLGGDDAYTSNYVGLMSLTNPYTILMNDFFFQLFRSQWDLGYHNIYNLFTIEDYGEFLNIGEKEFVIKVTSDERRRRFTEAFNKGEIASPRMEHFASGIVKIWIAVFNTIPSNYIIHKFLNTLTRNGEQILNYSQAEITALTIKFIEANAPYPVKLENE
jgi:hypothetical protein